MTGPEHYWIAEEQLADSDVFDASDPGHHPLIMQTLAAAQVHATLALAAATALGYDHVPTRDYQIWLAAAGTPQEAQP